METPSLPAALRQFIEAAIVAGDMALPFHYPRSDEDWIGLQSGFRIHGITGESLVSEAPGAWQPGWYVVAVNGFGDPFFVDLGEAGQGYPVRYAPIGAGRWEAEVIAPDLQRFAEWLAALRDLGDDDAAAQRLIETRPGLDTCLWREVVESRRNRKALEAEQEALETFTAAPSAPADWQHGSLVIAGMGSQKVKVAHLLKQVTGLSPQAALAIQPDTVVARGYLVHLRDLRDRLLALGATLEFRPDGPGPDAFRLNAFLHIESLINCVKARQERDAGYAVYSATGEAFHPCDEIFVADAVRVDAQGRESYPEPVTQRALRFAYSGERFQDVVNLAFRQKPDATHAEIIRALNHYDAHDDFLDLQG